MSDKPFSEREGFVQPKPVQIKDLDKGARTALYNAYLTMFNQIPYNGEWRFYNTVATRFFQMVADRSNTLNRQRLFIEEMNKKIEDIFFQSVWHESFDFAERLHHLLVEEEFFFDDNYDHAFWFSEEINKALKQENVGWKFWKGEFLRIQSQEEQETIERAMDAPYAGARKQIRRAVSLFSARPNPDCANSIKDSIGAVESICQEISGEKGFSAAVDKLGIPMHPAFKEAAKKLYGFASNEAGVRHAATSKPPLQVNQATARYMLIVCSAMVNFITDQKSDAK